jgi:KaiC/GvpD/RAD55 family RecA-like ATPase
MDVYYCDHCDQMVQWLPDAYSLLDSGPPGVGKTPQFNYWASFYLRNVRPTVWLAFDDFPSNVRKSLESYSPQYRDHENTGLLTYVDCYSSIAGVPSEEKYALKNRADLNELSLLLTNMLNEKARLGHPKIFLDSVTPLFTYKEPQLVVQFLASVAAKVKAKNAAFLVSITTGTVDEEVMRRLETIMDFAVELRFVEEGGRRKRQLRISKARGQRVYEDWVPIYIGSQALSIDVGDDPAKYERLKKMLYGKLS